MKKNLILFVLLVGAVCFINSCKKESSSAESPGTGTDVADASYYPTGDGTSYKYSVARTDSDGTQSNGERTTRYEGTQLIANTAYQVQVDSVNISGTTTASLSYFRKSETGVFFFLDTTGLAASTPELIPYLQYLTIDSEMRLLLLPVEDNSNWSVFKMSINAPGFSFSPVEVATAYDGKETLTLSLNSGNVDIETVRLKFNLKYQSDPLKSSQNFVAYGWLAKDIGFVKWEGSGIIIGAFTGSGINFADTSSVVIMNISDYNISE
jgi:hypothetical protein